MKCVPSAYSSLDAVTFGGGSANVHVSRSPHAESGQLNAFGIGMMIALAVKWLKDMMILSHTWKDICAVSSGVSRD